jgi:hypothetical protein
VYPASHKDLARRPCPLEIAARAADVSRLDCDLPDATVRLVRLSEEAARSTQFTTRTPFANACVP